MSRPYSNSVTNHARRRVTVQRNIVVLGYSMAGKTALCHRFVKGQYDEHYQLTLEDNFTKSMRYKGQEIEMSIKDTQGLTEKEYFRDTYCLGYHGYILTYSVDNRKSFEILEQTNQKLLQMIPNVARVLVGCKSDIVQRQVSYQEGEAFAQELGCAFVECSAKLNSNIDTVFHLIVDQIDKSSEPERNFASKIGMQCCEFFGCRGEEMGDPTVLERVLKVLMAITAVLGWASVFTGLALRLSQRGLADETALLGYIMLGFGLMISVVCGMGYYGLKHGIEKYLTLYWVSLSIIMVTEVVVWIILSSNKLPFISNHHVLSSCLFAVAILVKILSILFVFRYQRTQSVNDSPV